MVHRWISLRVFGLILLAGGSLSLIAVQTVLTEGHRAVIHDDHGQPVLDAHGDPVVNPAYLEYQRRRFRQSLAATGVLIIGGILLLIDSRRRTNETEFPFVTEEPQEKAP